MKKTEQLIDKYEPAMRFLADIARKYRVSGYYFEISNSEDEKWVAKIEFDDAIPYDSKHYWHPNDTILDAEKQIPYYVAGDENEKRRKNGEPYIEMPSCGSTISFWG